MNSVKFSDLFDSFRQVLEPGRGPEWLRANGEQFWRNQDRLLDGMESLSKGWFERRHIGTRAAQDAVVRMCSAENPHDALLEYQRWASGAFDRLMADAVAVQRHASVAGAAMLERVSLPLEASRPPTPPATAGQRTDSAA